MPKFTQSEKESIQNKLLTQGEKLFIQHGVKKVTVQDLVNSAGIAKGSFYAFYKSKEHLYAEILLSIQAEIMAGTQAFLNKNKSLAPKTLITNLIAWSYKEIEKHPLLLQHDLELWMYLVSKLPPGVADNLYDLDLQVAKMLASHGVKFKYEIHTIGGIFQSLAVVFDSLSDKDKTERKAIMDIVTKGIINEIVDHD